MKNGKYDYFVAHFSCQAKENLRWSKQRVEKINKINYDVSFVGNQRLAKSNKNYINYNN